MENGRNDALFQEAERAVRQMASCGLSHSAKCIQELILYAHALDTNQRAIIALMMRQRRLMKKQTKYIILADKLMTRKQRRKIRKKMKEGDK